MEAMQNKHHKVNWVDGMKINKNHFIAMENWMSEILRYSEQKNVSPIDYGLLAPPENHEGSLDVMVSVDGQSTIDVVLNACQAITLGGCQIDIDSRIRSELEKSGNSLSQRFELNEEEKEWLLVLFVNTFKRIPIGTSDSQEEPPRQPHVLPYYSLQAMPIDEIKGQGYGHNYLPIARLFRENGKITVDASFIPPCRSIQSHPDLKFTYNELGSFLNQMESYSLHITQKIYQKKQTNDLANMALYLSEQVMRYLNQNITEFRFVDRHGPPIGMISKLVNLARVIKSSLDVYVGGGKENFLNYLTNWCDLNQGAFESILMETINLDYTHNNINSTLAKVSAFTKLMLALFKKLSELDYIGKKADSGIFVKEETVDNNEVKGRRSFLLD